MTKRQQPQLRKTPTEEPPDFDLEAPQSDDESDYDYLPDLPGFTEEVPMSTPPDMTMWRGLLPPELAGDDGWVEFFQQQLINSGKRHRWSARYDHC